MTDPGIFRQFHTSFPSGTAAVFLDRDGVLVEETGYLHRAEEVQIISGVVEALSVLNRRHIPSVVVTNQAGIGRGYYGWEQFHQVQSEIHKRLLPAYVDAVWACAYHPSGEPPFNADHPFRKPNPGMLLDAAETLSLDLQKSWLVGDKPIDLEAALRAGLNGAILVRTGYGAAMESQLAYLPSTRTRIYVCDSLSEAVQLMEPWL